MEELIRDDWKESVLDTLVEYIKIPNQSPSYDPDWNINGYQQQAAQLLYNWTLAQNLEGIHIEIIKQENRTPMIFGEIEATNPESCQETILMYGHFDKQPPMSESWNPEFGGPHDPRIIDDKLYGRGGADDGYSIFAAICSIKNLQRLGIPHGRIVLMIEGCEESHTLDLEYYIQVLEDRIGIPSLVICLDSGCGNYEQFWITTSLRGCIMGELHVNILEEGVHSGSASGIVPSSFRILRQLLSRIEDEKTGEILIPEMHCPIPEEILKHAQGTAEILGASIIEDFPFVHGAEAIDDLLENLLLNQTWKPTLSVTGIAGIPDISRAGNVLRQRTVATLSFRLPPNVDGDIAQARIKEILEIDPPYKAHVKFEVSDPANGWTAPLMHPWLENAVAEASQKYFGKEYAAQGEGGTIPFMGLLGEKFPKALFVVTGVLGPESNAHGPNEFLHIPQAQKVTCVVADVVAAHYQHFSSA